MKQFNALFLLTATALLAGCGGAASSSSASSSASSTATSSISSEAISSKEESLSISASDSSASEEESSSIPDSAISISEESSSSEPTLPDFDTLKYSYGDFSIVGETGSCIYTYDSDTLTYTINVNADEKLEYTLSGFFQGKILVQNGDNLSSYKGVTFVLDNACLTNAEDQDAVIEFALDKKNVEIKAKKETENKIFATGSALAISSLNNIEFSGAGTLDLASYGSDMHTVKADGDVSIYGSGNINVLYSAHDAFHGKHLAFANDGGTAYSGTLNVTQAVSQAFDFETNKGKGSISVEGGTIIVDNAASVFKTDASLTIASGASVIATNLTEDPVVAGDNSSGLAVTIEGTFTVDGEPYTYSVA